ncbi:MAG: hypothetical protein F4W90_01780 [Gammaproteobacteria bacterium]|nr:hypothetical protein [Gammaproteobacteria bacterium]
MDPQIEGELQTIRAKVVQTALAKNWIVNPSDEERTLIRKFLQDRGWIGSEIPHEKNVNNKGEPPKRLVVANFRL